MVINVLHRHTRRSRLRRLADRLDAMSRGEGSPWAESTNLLGRSCHWCYTQPLLTIWFGLVVPVAALVMVTVAGGL